MKTLFIAHWEAIAGTSTGLKGVMTVPYKCKVRKVSMTCLGTSTHATAAVFYVTYRATAGVTTYDNDASTQIIAILKKLTATNQQGKMIYSLPNGTGFTTTIPCILKPGYQIAVYLHTANGDACTFDFDVECEFIPEEEANITNEVVTT